MNTRNTSDLWGLPVTDQVGINEKLLSYLDRHRSNPSRRPIADHTRDAFARANSWLEKTGTKAIPLILDSCCGRGDSSFWAAEKYPEALVIGIDKSAARLDRQQQEAERVYLVQADVRDFWRLARSAEWRLDRHHIFYPNPYPKADQLGKRWHASSSWPDILALGGTLSLRTNFHLYAEEWCVALDHAGMPHKGCNLIDPTPPASLFEAKYQDRGHNLYEVVTS